jgi:hypothetical protein
MPEYKECNTLMGHNKQCKRPALDFDEKGKCICHSELTNKSEVDFQYEINSILEDSQNDYYDFTGFIFPASTVIFPKIFEKPVYFNNAIFIEGNYIDFTDTLFKSECGFNKTSFGAVVDFSRSEFQKRVQFISTDFKGDALFNDTIFKTFIFFHQTIFRNEVQLGATFEKHVRFSKTKFIEAGNAYFNQANFLEGVSFEGIAAAKPMCFFQMKNHGYALFKKFTFQFDMLLDYGVFDGPVNFYQVLFKGRSSFKGTIFKEPLDFNKCTFFGDSEFIGTQILRKADFRNNNIFNNVSFANMIVGENSVINFEG